MSDDLSAIFYCNSCWNTFTMRDLTEVGTQRYCHVCMTSRGLDVIEGEDVPSIADDPNLGRNDSGRGARPQQGQAKKGRKSPKDEPLMPEPTTETRPANAQRSKATKQTFSGGSQTP